MLELSLAECAFIGLIALIFIGPDELPGAVKTVAGWIKSAKSVVADLKGSMAEIVDDSGVNDVKREIESEIKYIEDLDGNMQRIYDVKDIQAARKKDDGVT